MKSGKVQKDGKSIEMSRKPALELDWVWASVSLIAYTRTKI